MFKLIKFVFKLIGFLTLIAVLLPIIVLAIMYKDYSAPVDDFAAEPSLSFTDIAARKLDEFIEDDQAEDFNFTFTRAEANSALKGIYAANNPNFGSADTNLPELERKYAMMFAEYGGLKGVTLNFYDGGLTIEAGAEVGISGIYYKTTVYLDFGVSVEPVEVEVDGVPEVQTQYKLQIKNISFGNFPILWMYDLANTVFGWVAGSDLNTFIKNQVSGFGNFDLATKTVWVNTDDLIKMISPENDPNRPMLDALFGFIDEEALLGSGFADDAGGLTIGLGAMRSSDPGYTLSNPITSDDDVQQMFTGQLTSILLSSLGGGGSLNYDMHEQAFNALIDYYVGDSMNITQTLELGTSIYELSTQPMFARFSNNKVYFTVIMTLKKQGGTAEFRTDFTLETIPSLSADKQDLVFTVGAIDIGDNATVSSDKVALILALVGESDIIVGNQIILEDFAAEFAASGVTVDSISVVGLYLRFVLTPTSENAQLLNDLSNALNNVLTDIESNPELDALLSDPAYSGVADALEALGDNPDAETIAEALASINELTSEQQEALFETLYGAVDLDGLENLIPNA